MLARRCPPVLVLVLALVLMACGSHDRGGATTAKATATATATPAETAAGGCRSAQPGTEKVAKPAKPKGALDAGKTYVAQVATNCGSFEITLAVERAPKTSASFASLARQGFF